MLVARSKSISQAWSVVVSQKTQLRASTRLVVVVVMARIFLGIANQRQCKGLLGGWFLEYLKPY
jgi:hypothetical protein